MSLNTSTTAIGPTDIHESVFCVFWGSRQLSPFGGGLAGGLCPPPPPPPPGNENLASPGVYPRGSGAAGQNERLRTMASRPEMQQCPIYLRP